MKKKKLDDFLSKKFKSDLDVFEWVSQNCLNFLVNFKSDSNAFESEKRKLVYNLESFKSDEINIGIYKSYLNIKNFLISTKLELYWGKI